MGGLWQGVGSMAGTRTRRGPCMHNHGKRLLLAPAQAVAHGMAWHGMAWHGVARRGMAWHGSMAAAPTALTIIEKLKANRLHSKGGGAGRQEALDPHLQARGRSVQPAVHQQGMLRPSGTAGDAAPHMAPSAFSTSKACRARDEGSVLALPRAGAQLPLRTSAQTVPPFCAPCLCVGQTVCRRRCPGEGWRCPLRFQMQ